MLRVVAEKIAALVTAAGLCSLTLLCSAQEVGMIRDAARIGPNITERGQVIKFPGNAGPVDYVLGPGDQILVHVVNIDEINDKPISVDTTGHVRLPIAGTIEVSRMTVAQLQAELVSRLSTYVLQPDVSVSVLEFRSQPVSVLGAVKSSGIVQVQGRRTVVEMLALAGGLDPTAGSTLEITRRLEWGRIPLPGAMDDPSGQFNVARISLKSLIGARNPEENILIQPHDVISVPRAETVYVMGQVIKPGGFPLDSHEEITVLQALSMAGGFDKTAQARNSKLLRVGSGSARKEVPVDLQKILDGKTPDIAMLPNDILFIPNSLSKKTAIRAAETALQIGTGVLVWGKY